MSGWSRERPQMTTYGLGAMWRNPAEFTALRRLRSEMNAEL
jgi:hypothetical protein